MPAPVVQRGSHGYVLNILLRSFGVHQDSFHRNDAGYVPVRASVMVVEGRWIDGARHCA